LCPKTPSNIWRLVYGFRKCWFIMITFPLSRIRFASPWGTCVATPWHFIDRNSVDLNTGRLIHNSISFREEDSAELCSVALPLYFWSTDWCSSNIRQIMVKWISIYPTPSHAMPCGYVWPPQILESNLLCARSGMGRCSMVQGKWNSDTCQLINIGSARRNSKWRIVAWPKYASNPIPTHITVSQMSVAHIRV
jgi:hypothetical protein